MTTATRAIPARPSVAPDFAIRVPSESTPGVEYTTSAHRCSCPSFYFGQLHDATFRCKHMRRRFAPRRSCEYCHLFAARQLSCFCSAACAARAAAQDARDAAEAVAVAELIVATACPGYLREHPATDGVICHWCPSCDVEAVPASRVAA